MIYKYISILYIHNLYKNTYILNMNKISWIEKYRPMKIDQIVG